MTQRTTPRTIPVRLTATSKKLAAISQILDERIEADGAAHLALVRVAKVQEEAGEVMEAMIAYQHVNPRKPAGPLDDVIKELADLALTALGAIEHFGYDGEAELFERVRFVYERLMA
jgi:NTP pyrophosphatase (non-canonical NTP hydrolase)